jgi:eukaryotic-like serine/threonine-protein kinase
MSHAALEANQEADAFGGTERFEILGRLGQGGMGVVYRAFDRERQSEVAVKTLLRVNADGIHGLKREFRALAHITHPNLVLLYELLCAQGRWFFSMELVRGTDLLGYTRHVDVAAAPDSEHVPTSSTLESAAGSTVYASAGHAPAAAHLAPSFDEERLRSAFVQVARGLSALHDAGKLHGDVKASNTMVTADGRVVLLDFGLATSRTSEDLYDTIDGSISGTPAYMSPEQASGQPTTMASDWYSVGVMLFEALTGRLPFEGSFLKLMARKREEDPPSPAELVAGLPSDLADLCVALLSRSPGDRPSGPEVMRRLTGAPPQGPPAAVPRPAPTESFVGREPELGVLSDALEATAVGPVCVHVHGVSGAGKTSLVRHFLARLHERREAVVLAGRCYERESIPFKAFDSLMDSLARYLRRLPSLEAERLMPRDARVLGLLFPGLLRVEAVAAAPWRQPEVPDRNEERRRAFAALKELFGRMADRQPLAVFIDDLQWGDVDSGRLLVDLLSPPEPPGMLLVLCYRSETVGSSAVLQALRAMRTPDADVDVREIPVPMLPEPQARELALRLMGREDAAAQREAEVIAGEAQGSPLFIGEMVRYQRSESPCHLRFDDMLRLRIARLPECARRVLEIVAVAGFPLPSQTATRAAELDGHEEETLSLLRSVHLVRSDGVRPADPVECYHDRIREAVVDDLPAERLRQHHWRLAVALETQEACDPEALAVHWQGAGDANAAARYAAVAAARAATALAFDHAAGLYATVLELMEAAAPERPLILVQRGDALMRAGRGREAAAAYLEAAESAEPVPRLDLQRRATEQLLMTGHVDQGLEVARSLLATLGLGYPETPRRALLSLLFQRARCRLRGSSFRPRDEGTLPEAAVVRVDTCWSVGMGLSMVDPIRAADFGARFLLLALSSGERGRIARALVLHGGHHAAVQPESKQAAELVAAGQRMAEQTGNAHALGLARLTAGATRLFLGHWKEALELCDQADEIFRDRCTGVAWEAATAHAHSLQSLFWLGELGEFSRRVPILVREAQLRGNLYARNLLAVYDAITWLARDDLDAARQAVREPGIRREPSLKALQLQGMFQAIAEVVVDIYAGSLPAVWTQIDQQWSTIRRSLLFRVQHARFHMLWLHAMGALVAGSDDARLRAAEQDARGLARLGTAASRPISCAIRALVAAKRGRHDVALRLFADAAHAFDQAGMRLHAAAMRRRQGTLLGGDQGRALLEAADAFMKRQNIVNTERITAVLAPGWGGG